MASNRACCCLSMRTGTLLLLHYFLIGNIWSLLVIFANSNDSKYWKMIEKSPVICYSGIFFTLIGSAIFLAAIIYIGNNTPSIFLLNTAIVFLLWGMIYTMSTYSTEVETKNRELWENKVQIIVKNGYSSEHLYFEMICFVLIRFYSVLVFLRYMIEVKENLIRNPSARTNVSNEEGNFSASSINMQLTTPPYSPPTSPYPIKSSQPPFPICVTRCSTPPPPYPVQNPSSDSIEPPPYPEQTPSYSIEPPSYPEEDTEEDPEENLEYSIEPQLSYSTHPSPYSIK